MRARLKQTFEEKKKERMKIDENENKKRCDFLASVKHMKVIFKVN
jgi:hypothetical protein